MSLLANSAFLRAHEVDSVSADPDWYVAPVIPEHLCAPIRKTVVAATCSRIEAVQTFNIDSVLTEGIYYQYDDRGNVISTTVWSYSPDGTMVGKSKNEYAFDNAGTQTMTAVYEWDNAANDWKGTEKYEYAYGIFAGEKKMTSNTSLVWLNGAWVANQRYTYSYDEAGREIEYYEYIRNTISNDLQPFKGHVQTWTNDLQTLDILYTSYANGQWTAGTKKEWAFDEGGTQTMYATYSMSNGTWVGSSKETWTYGGPSGQLTLHEKYGWANNDWSKTLKEETEYAGANIIRIENYTYSNGVTTGTKKEITTYTSGKKSEFVTFTWLNGTWANATKETWTYGGPSGQLTLHEQLRWSNNDWAVTLREIKGYDAAGNNILIENYTFANGVTTGTKKEEYTFNSSKKKTLSIVYLWENNDWVYATKAEADYQDANQTLDAQYTWTNGAWVGTSKELWSFNVSNKRTLHEKYNWSDGDWVVNLREITNYDAQGNTILVENYSLTNNVWKGTKKEEYTFSGSTKTSTMTSVWDAGSNAFVYKSWSINNTVDTPNEKCSYNWVNNAWVGTGTRTLTTKENGKEIEKINQNWPSGATDWVNRTCTTTVYSGANKTQEAYYSWLNNAWVGVKRTDYHFNADNKNDTTTAYTYSNNDWNRYSRIVNTFNSSGTNIMTHTSKWQNNAWEMVSIIRTDIIIEEGKQLLNAQWRCGADSIWIGVTKDTAAYSPTGKKLLEARYTSWANNDWVPSYKIEHEYDEADREILNRRMDWVNNKWQGHYLYEYEYNDFGQQTSYTYYGDWNSSTDSWKGSSKYTYEYASNGLYSQQVMYRWQNNQWVGLFRYLYTYDAANHEIEQLVQGYSDGNWQNSQWYVHEYRGSEVVKNNEYRWRNEQWQFTRRNEKIYDNDTQAKLRREITGSWNTNGFLISYTDNHYFYDCDPHFYTVRFVNYDGQVLANMTAQEGESPVYPGSTPTKPADTENTYTFSGWTPALAPVTANITYTATFTAVKKAYTITWKNEDGSIISQETLAYGATPAHVDIYKESTAEYTYTFSGWTPGIGIVTGDATYQATFKETKNNYIIKFLNYNGEVLQSTDIEYGKLPEYTGVIPTKPADDQYRYAFAGWDKEIAEVVGEETYTAIFAPTSNEYTISWFNDDNTLIDQTTVAYGVVPTHADATKENTAEFTYTFSGWDHEPVAVVGNASYTATFTATKNSYTVTWLNSDNTPLAQTTVAYGETPVYTGEMPSRPSTAEYTYTFTGWTPQVVAVTGDAEYTALFDSIVNTYTVTFYWGNGTTILRQMQLPYGETPTISVTPGRIAENNCTYYSFEGWEPEIAPVTGNASYIPTYAEHYYEYMVTFRNYDRQNLQYSMQPCGFIPAYEGATPTRPGNAQYSYVFTGWTPELTEVTGEAIYTATFEKRENIYTIIFLDEDNSELDRTEVAYGRMPSTSVVPTKEDDEEYTYTFAGWSPQLKRVTGDATYTATYKPTAKTEGINNAEAGETATKVIIDNQIFIRRGGNIYTIDGQRVQ